MQHKYKSNTPRDYTFCDNYLSQNIKWLCGYLYGYTSGLLYHSLVFNYSFWCDLTPLFAGFKTGFEDEEEDC